jgi:hypothetical protein
LGLTTESFEQCFQTRSLEEVNQRLEKLRKSVKDRYRELALELHPDHHDDQAKEDRLKDLNDAHQAIEKFLGGLEVRPRPRVVMRPMPQVRIIMSQGANATTSTVTNTGATWFNPWTHIR